MTTPKASNPLLFNYEQLKQTKQTLAFRPDEDYARQKTAIDQKFRELLKMPPLLEKCIPITEDVDTSDPRFDEIRMTIETEPGFFVPAHLIYPKNITGKIPVVICLQGHTTGMHNSLGREMHPSKKPIDVPGDRDFAIQAVEHGYAAFVMEQRGFGELSFKEGAVSCHELAWQMTLIGKTLLGQRLADISNALTAILSTFDFLDETKVGITGNSGGGTSSYYAACLDERIKVTMPSSAFCSVLESWGASYHCDCAYIHNMLNFFEMGDLAVLIAPRYLIAVNGKFDHIQPYEAAEKEFEKVKMIYETAGFGNRCKFVSAPEGHRYYADLAWPEFERFIHA